MYLNARTPVSSPDSFRMSDTLKFGPFVNAVGTFHLHYTPPDQPFVVRDGNAYIGPIICYVAQFTNGGELHSGWSRSGSEACLMNNLYQAWGDIQSMTCVERPRGVRMTLRPTNPVMNDEGEEIKDIKFIY